MRLAAVAAGHQFRTAKRAWSKGPQTPEIVETIELEGVKGDLTRTLEGVDVVIPAPRPGPDLRALLRPWPLCPDGASRIRQCIKMARVQPRRIFAKDKAAEAWPQPDRRSREAPRSAPDVGGQVAGAVRPHMMRKSMAFDTTGGQDADYLRSYCHVAHLPKFRIMRLTIPALGVAGALLLGIGVISGLLTTRAKSTGVVSGGAGSEPDGTSAATYRPGAEACLAEAVYYETLGTSERAALAVAHVVLNRREHDEFPETICAVVTEGCQFSYRCDGKPETLSDAEERERAFRAAGAVLEGRAADPTDGALFFHSDEVPPGWFGSRDRTVEIGGNIFYR